MSPSTRRNLLIAVIAGALLLLAAAVVVLQAGPKRTETYLGPPDATAAHNPYFVLEKALLAAGQDARSQRYLRSLPETLQPTDTVVLAEHERGLNAAQRRGLRQFVANGGHLVLAVPGKAPTTLSPLLVDFGLQAAPACDRSTRQPCPLPVLAGDNPVLLEQPGHLRLRHGKGSLDLVDRLTPLTTGTRRRKAEHADVRSYHHDGLANPAHRELAARLLAPHWDAGGTFHLVHGQRQDRWWLLLLLQHWPFWLPLALLLPACCGRPASAWVRCCPNRHRYAAPCASTWPPVPPTCGATGAASCSTTPPAPTCNASWPCVHRPWPGCTGWRWNRPWPATCAGRRTLSPRP